MWPTEIFLATILPLWPPWPVARGPSPPRTPTGHPPGMPWSSWWESCVPPARSLDKPHEFVTCACTRPVRTHALNAFPGFYGRILSSQLGVSGLPEASGPVQNRAVASQKSPHRREGWRPHEDRAAAQQQARLKPVSECGYRQGPRPDTSPSRHGAEFAEPLGTRGWELGGTPGGCRRGTSCPISGAECAGNNKEPPSRG